MEIQEVIGREAGGCRGENEDDSVDRRQEGEMSMRVGGEGAHDSSEMVNVTEEVGDENTTEPQVTRK